ncbi:T9SS type A sorting domain-containing protein [bacterium]|nr:T9SS type A sorting domain-containing protein [bacterium]
MIKQRLITLVVLISVGLLLCTDRCNAEILEESGSLLEFFAGHEENCAYDNWVSHISEGIARAGYNDYAPPELDRQTNGFGTYQIVDSLENYEDILADWYAIFANVLSGNLEIALDTLEGSYFADVYQMVLLEDGDERYVIFREILNNDYFDDNGTEDETDDVTGSFDYGWGIFIFNLNPKTPEVSLEAPHPNDDFITTYICIDTFLRLGAQGLFVNGSGREVKWTESGSYDNSKTRSDPTRTANESAFQQAHKAIVDSVENELIIQVHSYDSEGRNLSQCLLSTWDDDYPNPPIFDRQLNFDLLHLTPLVPIAANSIGNAEHDSMRIDKYYAIWNFGEEIFYNNEIAIPDDMPSLQGWYSPQRDYSHLIHDERLDDENYLHVEHDEFPDVITEELLSFYPVGGVPTYETYANAVEFYRPMYSAINDYYHLERLHRIPEDYQSIQNAMDNSFGGDTILVNPGVYTENINFKGKRVILASQFITTDDPQYIESTIIDGNGNGRVIEFSKSENTLSSVVGLTITGGSAEDGAGIYCQNADPIIKHCVIAGNNASITGGGIFCEGSTPSFINCTITRNSANESGGGVFCWDGSNPQFTNCIMWDNQPQEVEFLRFGESNNITFLYSDVAGGLEGIAVNNNGTVQWLDGCINQDPIFRDAAGGDFHLWAGSPCIDAGSPQYPLDPDSTLIEMGVFPYYHRSLEATPSVIEFAEFQTGVIDSLPLTIHNTGDVPIFIMGQNIDPNDSPFSVGVGGGEVEIDSNSTHTIWIRFLTEVNGYFEAYLFIESNEEDQDDLEIILRAGSMDVEPVEEPLPFEFALCNIYPNPFNSSTNIVFTVPHQSDVTLTIYDLMGRPAEILLNGKLQSNGKHSVSWNASTFPAGLYFVRLDAGGFSQSKKLILVK